MAVAPVLGVATSIILAQMLGPVGRGQISTLTVWAQGAALFCFLSLDKGLVDAANRVASDRRQDAVVATLAGGRSLALGLSAIAGVAAMLMLLGAGVGAAICSLGAVAAFCTSRAEWRAGALIATRRWSRYNSWRIVQPVVYSAGLLALWAMTPLLSMEMILAGAAAIFAVSTLVGWLWLSSGLGAFEVQPRAGHAPIRPLLTFSARYHVTTVTTFASSRVDLLLAPFVMPFAGVGVYAVAVAPGSLIAAVASAALLRALTGHSPGRKTWLPVLAVTSAAGAGILLVPAVIPAAFGPEFVEAVLPAQILLVAATMFYFGQGFTGRLAHAGRPAQAALPATACVAIVSIGAVVVPTPVGLATAVLAGRVTSLLCALIIVRCTGSHEASPTPTFGVDPIS